MILKMIIPPISGHLSLTWLETSLNMVYNRSFVSKTVLLVVVTSGQRENIASIRKVRVLLIHDLLLLAKVSLFRVLSRSNTVSIRDDPYWTSRKNSLELIELSSINKVSLG